ncbi:hypothetical protein D3C73_857070 [compost metagenome]
MYRYSAICAEIAVFAVFLRLKGEQAVSRVADKRIIVRVQYGSLRIDQRILTVFDLNQCNPIHEITGILINGWQHLFTLRIPIAVKGFAGGALFGEQCPPFLQRIQIIRPRRSDFFALFINEGIAFCIGDHSSAFRKRGDKGIHRFHFFPAGAVNQSAFVLTLHNSQPVRLKFLGIIVPGLDGCLALIVDITPKRTLFQLKRRRVQQFSPQRTLLHLRENKQRFERFPGVIHPV